MINTWQWTLLDLGMIKTGLSLRINATFVLGAIILLAVKFIQDGGILRSANTTKILGISAMIPLLLMTLSRTLRAARVAALDALTAPFFETPASGAQRIDLAGEDGTTHKRPTAPP